MLEPAVAPTTPGALAIRRQLPVRKLYAAPSLCARVPVSPPISSSSPPVQARIGCDLAPSGERPRLAQMNLEIWLAVGPVSPGGGWPAKRPGIVTWLGAKLPTTGDRMTDCINTAASTTAAVVNAAATMRRIRRL